MELRNSCIGLRLYEPSTEVSYPGAVIVACVKGVVDTLHSRESSMHFYEILSKLIRSLARAYEL